jgi:hypothetical protein
MDSGSVCGEAAENTAVSLVCEVRFNMSWNFRYIPTILMVNLLANDINTKVRSFR